MLDKSTFFCYNVITKEREVIKMNTNPMTIAKCPRCGSTAQVREEEFEQTENGLNIKYSCGCGTRFIRIYELVAQFTLNKVD